MSEIVDESAEAIEPEVKFSLYDLVESPEMITPVNFATPATAAIEVVPSVTQPAVSFETPSVMVAVLSVTRLPSASRTSTQGWVVSASPTLLPPTGCLVMVRRSARPKVKLTEVLVEKVGASVPKATE